MEVVYVTIPWRSCVAACLEHSGDMDICWRSGLCRDGLRADVLTCAFAVTRSQYWSLYVTAVGLS